MEHYQVPKTIQFSGKSELDEGFFFAGENIHENMPFYS